jgi:2'-5' RNA ligase
MFMTEPPSPPETIRCFLALDLSDEVRGALADLLERLQKGAMFSGAHPTWVRAESIHLTLHFLGSVEMKTVETLTPELDAVAARIPRPRLEIRRLGCFPNDKAPKVLWIGVARPDPNLLDLHRSLVSVLEAAGLTPERGRPYHPHLTLARIKSMRGLRGLMDVVASHRAYDAGECRPGELILFKSELRPEGAVYTPLHRSPLAPPRDSA